MSAISNPINTGQQMTTNYDLSKIFVFNNRYETDNYVNNSSYNPITILAGTVMGRVALTGVLVPFVSTSNDGSQYPIGILAQDVQLAAGQTAQCSICIAGDVAAEKVILWSNQGGSTTSGDTLDTIVSGTQRRVRDMIQSHSVGIILRPGTEMTGYDNQ